nr:hypothetical protein GCM10010200_022450 [Actinomadura rugatobispora]
MCAAGALRGRPSSITRTDRRARPSMSAALKPAGPPPTTATSYRPNWGFIVTTSAANVPQPRRLWQKSVQKQQNTMTVDG